MKNLLFLGNSHNAFLHDALKYYPDKDFRVDILSEVKHDYEIGVTTTLLIDNKFKATFISKISDYLPPTLEIIKGQIVTNDDTTKKLFQQLDIDRIILKNYDAIIMYGFGLMSIDTGICWRNLLEEYNSNKFSSDCLNQAYLDDIYSSSHYKLLKKIELDGHNNTKILSIPTPLVSEENTVLKDIRFHLPNFLNNMEQLYKQEIEKIMHVSFVSMPKVLRAKNQYSINKEFSCDTFHLTQAGSIILFNEIINILKNISYNE